MVKERNTQIAIILKWAENKTLRQVSKKIDTINQDLVDFAGSLMETMREKDWMWLAAPQIWKNIRMVAITQWIAKKDSLELKWEEILINPEYVFKSKEMEIDEEWCLSLPWMMGNVSRHKEIKIKYTDIQGRQKTLSAQWINARIIQHELDHLDWILFIDKVIEENKFDLWKIISKKTSKI